MAEIGDQLLQPEVGWKRYKAVQAKEIVFSTGWSQLTGSNGIDWNGTNIRMASTDLNAKASIKFYSSKIRVTSTISAGHSDTIEIDIDGVKENISLKNSITIPGALVYEKELELGEHIITFTNKNTGYIIIDCIDLLGEDARLIENAPIGFPLPKPETSWQRYDDAHELIRYDGVWDKVASKPTGNISEPYNNSLHWSNDINATVNFKFYGTKLRLTNKIHYNHSKKAKVIIDGIDCGFFDSYSTTALCNILLYEKTDLELGMHTVQIFVDPDTPAVDGTNRALPFDCFDIDSTGYIAPKIGDISTSPKPGWNRHDNLESVVLFEGINWIQENIDSSYDKTISVSNVIGDYCQFDMVGKAFEIISKTDSSYLNGETIEVFADEVSIGKFNLQSSTTKTQTLVFEHEFETIKRCTIKIKNIGDKINIDCIDIKAGNILPQLSKDYEFPVAVIEKEDLVPYCNSLINGEEQLLLIPEEQTFEMVLTDGKGNILTSKSAGGGLDPESTLDSTKVNYTNTNHPEITNVKEALDFVISNMGSANKDIIKELNDFLSI